MGGAAAGVVADHAAEGAAVVGGRPRPEDQPMLAVRALRVSRTIPGWTIARRRSGSMDSIRLAVLGPVQHHRDVAALAGQAGAAAAGETGASCGGTPRRWHASSGRAASPRRSAPGGSSTRRSSTSPGCRRRSAPRPGLLRRGHGPVRRRPPWRTPVSAGRASPPHQSAFSCWIRSLNSVVAMDALCGWPRRKASANFLACS